MRTLMLALVLGLLVGCADEGVDDGYVRLVLLPDTQCYTRFAPEVMEAQARFIERQQERMNIVHVAHLGDITDLGTEEEWQRARSALLPLFGQVSMTLVSGNHDLGENGSANTRASRMDSTFAPAELMVSDTFDGGVQNSFTLVEDRLLVLGLEFAPRAAVVAWASGVLAAHPERAAIVVTHAYLGPDGERYDHLGDAPQDFSPYQYGVASGGDVHDGEELWQALISQHENVVMVVSGHVPQGFEVLLSEGAGGHEVVQLMADYQRGTACDPNGTDGQGYLLLLELPEDGVGDIRVRSYSPFRERWHPDHHAMFADWGPRFQEVGSRLMADIGLTP
ncbi:MAG: metallophosphoesterase [Sandaracinaceae bacterium]|nr:metallophosphoesterase [Sandaracinaceae bacterium]